MRLAKPLQSEEEDVRLPGLPVQVEQGKMARYRFGLEPRGEEESVEEFDGRRWSQLREFKKFMKLQWGKIPQERRREILSKKGLSDDFLRFYDPFIDHIRGSPIRDGNVII